MGIKIFGFFVTLMVAVVTIAALITVGLPGTERGRRFDEQRVSDLRQIAAAVDLYYSKNGHLPTSLNDLVKPEVARLYYIRSIVDPETSQPYDFLTKNKSEYQLCAKFNYSNIEKLSTQDKKVWEHSEGYKCFDLLSPPSKTNQK